MNPLQQQILANIRSHGCHVNAVFDPDGLEPTFCYSVGLGKTFDAPEVIVIGLQPELGAALINLYRDRASAGDELECGVPYSGFLVGFPICIGPVAKHNRANYMLSACWLYGDSDFEAVQIVYPSTSGVWPWEAGASGWFRNNQPCLAPGGRWTGMVDEVGSRT